MSATLCSQPGLMRRQMLRGRRGCELTPEQGVLAGLSR